MTNSSETEIMAGGAGENLCGVTAHGESVSRQALWARGEKERMKKILGGKCRHCGTTENLTFDCIISVGGEHHRSGSVARVSFYKRQMSRGNLQVLCALCNSRKQDHAEPKYSRVAGALSEQPSRFDTWG